jgi:hypothetical protein
LSSHRAFPSRTRTWTIRWRAPIKKGKREKIKNNKIIKLKSSH